MNITYVNALAFIGRIGLAAMHSESLPSDAGMTGVDTTQQSKMQQAVPATATPLGRGPADSGAAIREQGSYSGSKVLDAEAPISYPNAPNDKRESWKRKDGD